MTKKALLVVIAFGLTAGMAWAQSTATLGSGISIMQHRSRNHNTGFNTMGLVGQPVGIGVYLGSRFGLHLGAELVRPYLSWIDGAYLESGAAHYGYLVSAGFGTRHNFSDRRFLLASAGIASSGLSLYHGDDLRTAYSNWGPSAQAAMYFRTRHNIYAFAGANAGYHPDLSIAANSRYKSGFSGGLNLGIAAASPVRRSYPQVAETP